MDALEKLLIKDECQALSLRFGRLQDERRYEELPGLMTADGTYTRLGEELIIADFIEWVGTMPPNKTRHFVTPTEINVIDSSSSTGLTYYTLYLYGGDNQPPYPLNGPFVVGEYQEEFSKTENGWKIRRRKAIIIFKQNN
ncbi:MAG: nuclear transport factor 2 family protein [Pseudomonadota bacterium]|nr:nuclear transport factor 2 family protein [Pseudomonadota bacterium]